MGTDRIQSMAHNMKKGLICPLYPTGQYAGGTGMRNLMRSQRV